MNGIDNILSRITDDARREADAVLQAAKEQCAEIEEKMKKAEQDEYWKIVSAGTSEAESRLSRVKSGAALETRKQELALKQEMVSAAFDRASEMLSELPEDRYIALFARLAAEASITGAESIIMNEKDAEQYGRKLCDAANGILRSSGKKGELSLSSEHRAIKGGFILSAGSIETNCGADALVAQYKDMLSVEVADILFGTQNG